MNTNETHGGFFQFPLCLLAQPVPFDELLGRCFFSGVCHYLDVTLGRHWRDSAESREEGMKRARTVIGFSEGSVSHFLENEKAASRFVQEWQQAGRTTCFVRLRKDIYFATRDHGALSERDWRVLCGIYSAIGEKPMAELGWQRSQWRAAGWLTKPGPRSQPCGPLYPRGQIERTLAKLLERKFVFAATYRRGERFWSHRLDQQGIWAEVTARKHRASPEKRKQLDKANSAILYAQLHPLAINKTPAPPATSQ